jgi:hypothetical protein
MDRRAFLGLAAAAAAGASFAVKGERAPKTPTRYSGTSWAGWGFYHVEEYQELPGGRAGPTVPGSARHEVRYGDGPPEQKALLWAGPDPWPVEDVAAVLKRDDDPVDADEEARILTRAVFLYAHSPPLRVGAVRPAADTRLGRAVAQTRRTYTPRSE